MNNFKIGGAIVTKMNFSLLHPKEFVFNLFLWIYQTIYLMFRYPHKPRKLRRFAAKISHLRLDLGRSEHTAYGHDFFSQTSPHALIETWNNYIPLFKSFTYLPPNFECSEVFAQFLRAEARALCGNKSRRRYDYLQLLSYLAHLPLWLILSAFFDRDRFGHEYFKVFNLPGRGVCSSAFAALLRLSEREAGERGSTSKFFGSDDEGVISPCDVVICGQWNTDNIK